MSELKAVHAFDVYEAYTKTGDDDAAQVYLKSEADKVIARHKYKRCMAMARWCDDRWIHAYHLNKIEKTRFYVRWRKRWLELAEKFKPNSTAK